MRSFVQLISYYGKSKNPNFIIIPQNGHELLTENGEAEGTIVSLYLDSIDGVGRESLFYGDPEINQRTPIESTNYMLPFMELAEDNNIEVLVTDYCSENTKIVESYNLSENMSFISFAADHRALDNIPSYPGEPEGVNALNITSLSDALNFLYIINPGGYGSKEEFLNAIGNNNYDIILIDLFDNEGIALSLSDVNTLKIKNNGGSRLVIAYMSIGEAEDYRYYWQPEWNSHIPDWMEEENPNWPGNYKVRYWETDWQNIIFGNENAYLDMILNAGFDGVYLDIIDGFEYFES